MVIILAKSPGAGVSTLFQTSCGFEGGFTGITHHSLQRTKRSISIQLKFDTGFCSLSGAQNRWQVLCRGQLTVPAALSCSREFVMMSYALVCQKCRILLGRVSLNLFKKFEGR